MRDRCHWCGVYPEEKKFWENDEKNRTIEYSINGIDRIDTTGDYVTDNVVPCCKVCNRAKNDLEADVFLQHVAKVVSQQSKY